VAEPVLTSIEIEGFLSIRSASVSLGQLNVLVGANGAGKSNLVRGFELLGRLADEELGLFVGRNGGASALLHSGEPRMRLVVNASTTAYEAMFEPAANDELIFRHEVFSRRAATAVQDSVATGGRRESTLAAGGGGSVGRELHALLSGCRAFHFHDTSFDAPVKQFTTTADNLALRSDAANLAAVLFDLANGSDPGKRAAYRRILGAVRQVAPFFRDFVLQPENNDRIRLRWRQTGSDAVFSANQMSDGTLRFVCLATLLLQPELPGLVVLDEPELGLHPFAITQLADLLRQASARSQVLFATQSVTLISQFELADLVVADRRDGASEFSRPDPDSLAQWLAEYSLGELWEKNLFGGRPHREDRGVDG
jgi:predicted ATPase